MSEYPANLPAQPKLHGRRHPMRDIFEIALLIMMTFTPINLITARAIVDGPSMQPTLVTGNLVVVNRLAYFFSPPQRGDVIVLHNPRYENGDDLIKRVIGLPGEHIKLVDGRIYINGTLLEEPYVKKGFCGTGCNGEWTLTNTQYFILGDNRPQSYDSHNFGPVEQQKIVGQAWIIYWPINEFRIIDHPRYEMDENQ